MNKKIENLQISINNFLALATDSNWELFDQQVSEVCNNPIYLGWAIKKGLRDRREPIRDLAISIFEQTSQSKLKPGQQKKLNHVFIEDESLHLRRKAAFALFKFGDRRSIVIERIKEARENDLELKTKAEKLLTQL